MWPLARSAQIILTGTYLDRLNMIIVFEQHLVVQTKEKVLTMPMLMLRSANATHAQNLLCICRPHWTRLAPERTTVLLICAASRRPLVLGQLVRNVELRELDAPGPALVVCLLRSVTAAAMALQPPPKSQGSQRVARGRRVSQGIECGGRQQKRLERGGRRRTRLERGRR